MDSYFYKIQDTEDNKYSEYLETNKECGKIIHDAVFDWLLSSRDESVFATIEKKLDKNNISYRWFKFDNTNTINF